MVDLKDFIYKIDSKNRKTKRYKLSCDGCLVDRGYGMASRSSKLCKKCMTKKDHLKECVDIANRRGGKCLSTKWTGSTSKYEFLCGDCSHLWKTYSYVIRRGSWCPKCSNKTMAKNKIKKGIRYCSELAHSKGGLFLSTVYKNNTTSYLWRCHDGHEWKTRLSVIEGGSWCPLCFASNGRFRKKESTLRGILEDIFKTDFPSSRPQWLVNPDTGYKLELDCYSESLKLAFEYDGELHYKDVDFFKNISKKQQVRDKIKDELCKNNGVNLIRISYKRKRDIRCAVMEAIDGLV